MTTLDFTLRKETEAVRLLLDGMRALFTGDDTSLVLDTIEGETDLLEAIDAVIAEIDETDVLVTGLREKETQFAARRRSMEERVKRLRSLIEQAMAISEQHSLRRPAATLSLRQDTARCGGDVGGGGAVGVLHPAAPASAEARQGGLEAGVAGMRPPAGGGGFDRRSE